MVQPMMESAPTRFHAKNCKEDFHDDAWTLRPDKRMPNKRTQWIVRCSWEEVSPWLPLCFWSRGCCWTSQIWAQQSLPEDLHLRALLVGKGKNFWARAAKKKLRALHFWRCAGVFSRVRWPRKLEPEKIVTFQNQLFFTPRRFCGTERLLLANMRKAYLLYPNTGMNQKKGIFLFVEVEPSFAWLDRLNNVWRFAWHAESDLCLVKIFS